jgi:hypothetical protein
MNELFAFSKALKLLKQGESVQRAGWNGKNMFIRLVIPTLGGPMPVLHHIPIVEYLPYLEMKTADNRLVPWLASQTDILAEDWQYFNNMEKLA